MKSGRRTNFRGQRPRLQQRI